MKIQLLEPEGFPAAALERLRGLGSVIEGAADDTSEVEAVFTRLARVLDEEFHARYPQLRWIVSPTTGLNHIALDHFAAHGVEVISLRGRTEFLDNIHATAEHTLALALALIRKLPAAAAAVAERRLGPHSAQGARTVRQDGADLRLWPDRASGRGALSRVRLHCTSAR